jgi:hypothetical protein
LGLCPPPPPFFHPHVHTHTHTHTHAHAHTGTRSGINAHPRRAVSLPPPLSNGSWGNRSSSNGVDGGITSSQGRPLVGDRRKLLWGGITTLEWPLKTPPRDHSVPREDAEVLRARSAECTTRAVAAARAYPFARPPTVDVTAGGARGSGAHPPTIDEAGGGSQGVGSGAHPPTIDEAGGGSQGVGSGTHPPDLMRRIEQIAALERLSVQDERENGWSFSHTWIDAHWKP